MMIAQTNLYCTLEELYLGCQKVVQFSRKVRVTILYGHRYHML